MGDISLKNIFLKFDDSIIINNLSENIYNGELYALIGSSGSGKTVLLKIIAGLTLFNSGSIEVNGKNITKFSQRQMLDYHKNCGFVFQNSALISNMTIYENLSLYYNYHTDMPDEEIYEKIKKFLDYEGFSQNLGLRPSAISVGERMLVNIVRATFHGPEFILWDNPLADLDAIYQRRVKKIIADLKKQNKTMILVTNDFDFALSNADRIGILHNGKIIESAAPIEIKDSSNAITRELMGRD